MYSIEEHRAKFNLKVLEEQEKKGKNSRMLSKTHFEETVNRLKLLENYNEKRSLFDINLMRRFSLMRVQVNGTIVEKLVKPLANLRFIPNEELFDTVHETHIEQGHPGREIMQKVMAAKFANVTVEHVKLYNSLCEKCGLKNSKARRGVVVKPIMSPKIMSRGQVDLVDMQVL